MISRPFFPFRPSRKIVKVVAAVGIGGAMLAGSMTAASAAPVVTFTPTADACPGYGKAIFADRFTMAGGVDASGKTTTQKGLWIGSVRVYSIPVDKTKRASGDKYCAVIGGRIGTNISGMTVTVTSQKITTETKIKTDSESGTKLLANNAGIRTLPAIIEGATTCVKVEAIVKHKSSVDAEKGAIFTVTYKPAKLICGINADKKYTTMPVGDSNPRPYESLTPAEKKALLEKAIKSGSLTAAQKKAMLQNAVSSSALTSAEKKALIEAAIKSSSLTSVEKKALLAKAIKSGSLTAAQEKALFEAAIKATAVKK